MHSAFSRPLTSAASTLAITFALTAYAHGQQAPQPLPELKVEQRRATPAPARRTTAARPTRPAVRGTSGARSQPQTAVAPATPAVPPVGGRPTETTTAGPVRGYQALTSVSATRTDLPIQNTPQSVVVLPRKVLDDQGTTTISEALQNVSGTLPYNPLTFAQQNPRMRGFAAERTVDGLPNYYDPGARDLAINVERLEVIKGPQGVLFSGGTNATGGVINTVSKLPTASHFAEFGIMGGTNRYLSPYFDVNQPLSNDGSVLFRVTGQYQTQHHDINTLNTRNVSITPTLVWTNRNGTTLTLQGHYSRRDQQDYSGLPTVGTIDRSLFSMSRDLFPGHPAVPKTKTDLTSLTAKLDHEFNSNWSWSTVARISRSGYDEPSQGLTSNRPSSGSSFDIYNLKIDEKMQEVSLNTALKGRFVTGPAKHNLLLALDYNRVIEKGGMWGDFLGTPTNYRTGPFPAYTETGPFWGTWLHNSNRYAVAGATAQLQSSFHDRLHLLVGGRLGNIRVSDNDLTGTRFFVSGRPNLAETNTTRFLPRVGIAYDLTKAVTVFAGYSEGMRPLSFLLSREPMKPELSKQAEAGIKFNTDFGFSATFAAFDVRRRNVAVSDPATFGFTSLQTGEQHSRGFEADAVYQPNENWSFLGSYAFTDTEVVKDTTTTNIGRALAGVPRHAGRFWGNYTVTTGDLKGLSFGAGVYASSSVPIELGGPWKAGSYATIDAKIAYETKGWKLALHAKNLTDTKYFTRYDYFSGRVAPGAGRGLYANASVKF
jgi:iron complex outermembrane receptor protein